MHSFRGSTAGLTGGAASYHMDTIRKLQDSVAKEESIMIMMKKLRMQGQHRGCVLNFSSANLGRRKRV